MCSFRNMFAKRQTHTHTHTETWSPQYPAPLSGGVKNTTKSIPLTFQHTMYLLTMQQANSENVPAGHVTRQKYSADWTDVANCCHLDTDDVAATAVSWASPAAVCRDWRRLVCFSMEIWELEEPAMQCICVMHAMSAVNKCTANKLRPIIFRHKSII